MTERRAARSEGYLAMGLQNARGEATAWSMVRARWWGVMVALTLGGSVLTCVRRVSEDGRGEGEGTNAFDCCGGRAVLEDDA